VSLHPLVGHEDVRKTILGAVARESLPAALLVHGPKGVGKQRLALWIGQLLMCDSPTNSGPCDRCGPCKMGLNLEHPDLNWYFPLLRPKGASGERLVGALEDARMEALADRRAEPLQSSHFDELRGLYLGMVRNLRRRATMRPAMAEGQIFVIGNAELLVPQESSPEAANALLKLLEEPPGAARFILTTSEPGRLLATIRSRTVPVHVAGLPDETVASFLVDARGVDHQVALWAARLSQGSIGRALGFLPDRDDLGSLEALRRKAYALIAAAMAGGPVGGYTTALGFSPAGARKLVDLFGFAEEWLRDLGAVASGAGDSIFNHDAREKLEEIVSSTGVLPSDIANALTRVEEARELAFGNVNPQLIVDGLVRALRKALKPQRTREVVR